MLWNKHITGFFILLFLVSTFMVTSHHHENTVDDHDCPICIAGNHLSAASQWMSTFDTVPNFTATTVDAPAPVFIDNIFSHSLRNRAPPV